MQEVNCARGWIYGRNRLAIEIDVVGLGYTGGIRLLKQQSALVVLIDPAVAAGDRFRKSLTETIVN